jgi:hypothetical protein
MSLGSAVNCVYAYTVVTEAIDATGAMEIDFELNAAGGTEFASISVSGLHPWVTLTRPPLRRIRILTVTTLVTML